LNETTYNREFSVYVTDANGVAVGNQTVVISVVPEEYYKGALSWDSKQWSNTRTARGDAFDSPTAICPNEDVNRDGVLSQGEDVNGNGQLTPGNIVVAAPGVVTTDSAGRARFDLQYGEQFAWWSTVRITARASVAGTESKQSIRHFLWALTADVTNETSPPANSRSPFGLATSCTDPN